MPKTIYLEAPARSQDLYTAKWAFRAAGYVVNSTWHDEVSASAEASDHWSPCRIEQMKQSDALVVVFPESSQVLPDLALAVGIALANGLEVIWVGPPIGILGQFKAVRCFAAVEQLRKYLLDEQPPWQIRPASDGLLAA